MSADTLLSLWLLLYAWDDPARLEQRGGPSELLDAELGFSVLVPARGEQAVIGGTIARLSQANYPPELFEIIVICQADDAATISAVRTAIEDQTRPNVRLEIYDRQPFNKPHALQHGHAVAQHDVICVFDAEDDVHPDIFGAVNTVMVTDGINVVQGGVQLMNLEDHWFSALNCLEYFLYFGSRMHFNANVGMIPLGGNTVFLTRTVIDRIGGWDITCLTEDADLGVRLSAEGERIRVMFDRRWITREETPHSVGDFVRQRARWHQGFLQVLAKGHWRRIDGFPRRLLAVITFAHPLQDAVLGMSTVCLPLAVVFLHLPVLVTLILLLPLYALAMQLVAYLVALVMFCEWFELRVPRRLFLLIPVAFLPYQLLLSVGAVRAVLRQLLGLRGWEKTTHRGAHRTESAELAISGPELALDPEDLGGIAGVAPASS